MKLVDWAILRTGKTWASLHTSLASPRMAAVIAFIGITVVTPITFANSGSAISSISICSARNLSGAAWLLGEAGYQVGILTLENNGPRPCRLPTRPSIVLVWHGTTLGIHQIPMTDGQSQSFGGAALSVLKPHAKSAVGLAWHNWCQTLPPKISPSSGFLLVSLSHSSSPLRINMKNIHPVRCDLPSEQSTLAVGRFRSP